MSNDIVTELRDCADWLDGHKQAVPLTLDAEHLHRLITALTTAADVIEHG